MRARVWLRWLTLVGWLIGGASTVWSLPLVQVDGFQSAGVELRSVPEKYREEYFRFQPNAYLLDPQHLLEVKERDQLLSFLKYHAEDSALDLYIYVFGGDQELPREMSEDGVMRRFFSKGKPAVVVSYFYGMPQRAVMDVSPDVAGKIVAAEKRRALDSCVLQASKKTGFGDQLEAFVTEMSIRVYWMERVLKAGVVGEVLAVLPQVEKKVNKRKGSQEKIVEMWGYVSPHLLWVGVGAAGLVGLVGIWGVRYVMRRRAACIFQVLEVEPRLGGGHGAGVGAVISFSRQSPSPSAQRQEGRSRG